MHSPIDPDRQIIMGRIVDAFGLQGEVRIHTYTADPAGILQYPTWFVGLEDSTVRPMKPKDGRLQGRSLIVRFAGIHARTEAEALIGMEIRVPRNSLPETDADSFYWVDLIGCQVISDTQEKLGQITELLATGANDVLVVHSQSGAECLLPFIQDVILDVDLATRVVRVHVPNGL